ncbi:MAG: hypothetical protein FD144_4793 [Rhodospirillaceae bacterium]|nr:MAG: hypothetical protein FD144_4793 [Rhodospirillaceae bacterium]
MPDGINPASLASASPFLLSSPSRLIPAAIAAVTPLIDPEEGGLRTGLSNEDVAIALRPIAGEFTISDALMVLGGIDMAANLRSDITGDAGSALCVAFFTFRDFVLSAHPTCREDVAAREGYLAAGPTIPNDLRPALWKRLRFDISELIEGRFDDGHLFGGAQVSPNEDNEPEPWWDFHRRLTSEMAK